MATTTDTAGAGVRGELGDAIIVGGGAAGLSAGIVLARAPFATLIVDGGPPRNAPAEHIHGYLTRDGMLPTGFVTTGKTEFTGYGGSLVRASVVDAKRDRDGTFELCLADRRLLRARSVLVATGLTDELPNIPGLAERWASTVHHCPHCHGYEVRGKTIVAIGSPMAAVSTHVAALMRRFSSSVTLCLNGIELGDAERRRLTAYGVRLVDRRVIRLVIPADTAPDLVGIELDNGQTLACEAIFVAPRPAPHDAVLAALGTATEPVSRLVAVDPQGATDIPGVWAAGNVVAPRAQAITAAGAGTAAAISMTGWLLEQDLSAAVGRDGLDIAGAR